MKWQVQISINFTRDNAQGGAAASRAKKPRTLTLSKRDEIMNEWALYKSEEVAEGAVEASGGPLGWWQKASRIYPHIAMLARKYLAVQASPAASERVFSVGGLVVAKKRNRFGGERVGGGGHNVPS